MLLYDLFEQIPSAEKTTINLEKTTITDGDLISRKQAIDKMEELVYSSDELSKMNEIAGWSRNKTMGYVIQYLNELPSANQTDGDLISQTDLLKDIAELKKSPWFNDGKDIKDLFRHNSYVARKEAVEIVEDLCIKKLSSAEKTAEWIEVIDEIDNLGNKTWHHECSVCGNRDSGWGDYKYCPNCGAKIERGVKNNGT